MDLDMPCAAGLRRQLPGHTTATLGSWAKLAAKSHFPARPEGQSNDCERKSTWPKKNRHRHAEVKSRCEIMPATLLSRSRLRHRSVNPCARRRATVSLLASREALRAARRGRTLRQGGRLLLLASGTTSNNRIDECGKYIYLGPDPPPYPRGYYSSERSRDLPRANGRGAHLERTVEEPQANGRGTSSDWSRNLPRASG